MMRLTVKSMNTFIAVLLVVLMSSVAQAQEFRLYPYGLVKLDKKDRQCGIVKVHSLIQSTNGTLFRQEGFGWVVRLGVRAGILTPFHVVADGHSVVAECDGTFIRITTPTINQEKDLAYFLIENKDLEKASLVLSPLLVKTYPGERPRTEHLDEAGKSLAALLNPDIPRSYYKNKPLELALSAASFGIASMPNSKDPISSVIMSPDHDLSIQVQVSKNKVLNTDLFRIQGLGVRPGISGSALFGVIYNQLLTQVDTKNHRLQYSAPLNMLPKMFLGMVTKTRLNGAETVAVSMEDIFSFLETEVTSPIRADRVEKDVQLHYFVDEENSKNISLKSYLSVRKGAERILISEYCTDTYQVSAEWAPLHADQAQQNAGQKDLSRKAARERQARANEEQKRKQELQQFFNADDMRDVNKYLLRETLNLTPEQKRMLQRSARGGGDYGEGGDAFAGVNTEFILTSFQANDFGGAKKIGSLRLPEISTIPSLGLYKSSNNCKQQGLMVGDKLISRVQLPGGVNSRMINLEDFYSFYSEHKENTLSLLQQHGTYEVKKIDLPLPENMKLEIPLIANQMAAKDLYFKNTLIAAKANGKTDSKIEITKDGFQLVADSRLPLSNETLRLHLKSVNNSWTGSLLFSNNCRIELKPESFRNANSWMTKYKDETVDLDVSLMAQTEFLRVVINKVNSSCSPTGNLALGEIEVQLNGRLTAVIGTPRTAIISSPTDLGFFIKDYGNTK